MFFIRFIYLLAITLVISVPLTAQMNHSGESQSGSDTHHDHLHDPHKFHIGIGAAATYINGEGHLAPGFHFHMIRQLGHQKQWGLGLGYETILDEHWHNGLNLLINYRPLRVLSLIAGPGVVIGKHDGKTELLPAFHTEAVFEFNVKGLHVGPMIGFGTDREDSHVSLGLHIGIGL